MGRRSRVGGWSGLNLGLYEGESHEHAGSPEPFFAYVYEFARFATPDFEGLLAESRKQHVGFVLSFQTLVQTRTLDRLTGDADGMERAILGNVCSFVCFQNFPHNR